MELIERKARGETIDAPEAEEIAPEADLLGALEASLERQGGGRSARAKAKKTKKAPRTQAGKPARSAR
jgi:non-homologous end joining protein Ku